MNPNKAICYFQSGGPTAVINSSLYGVVSAYRELGLDAPLYGAHYGVEGLLGDDFYDLRELSDEDLSLLKQTPGAVLGTSRKFIDLNNAEEMEQLTRVIEKRNIGYILPNGGNDSMSTARKLSLYFQKQGMDVKVIGIPKTVDNDLYGCDFAPGFGSAAKSIANATQDIVLDAAALKKGRIVLLECMGRDAGWLTGSAMYPPKGRRPDAVFLPEMGFDVDEFLALTKDTFGARHHAIFAMAEGLPIAHSGDAFFDHFGHTTREGSSDVLKQIIEAKLGIQVRVIRLSTFQRADASMISKTDQEAAIMTGKRACLSALEGKTGFMVGVTRIEKEGKVSFTYPLVPLKDVADVVVPFPKKYIGSHTEMAPAFYDYLRPIVDGEVNASFDQGLLKPLILE